MSETVEKVAIKQVDAAERYGVSTRTLLRWEKSGKLTGTRIGGIKLYPVKDLDRLTIRK